MGSAEQTVLIICEVIQEASQTRTGIQYRNGLKVHVGFNVGKIEF